MKSNELIQKSRYELSLTEQKTIAYICSMIKPMTDDTYQLDYEMNIRDYCKICGIDYDNGKNYIEVKKTLKKLADRSMWLVLEDGSETLIRWLDRVTTNKRCGNAKIRLDDRLIPYLFDLKEKFTQYQLYNILAMKSGFSVRLYEIFKSYKFQHSKKINLDNLKKMLMVENVKSYENFKDFRKRVLDISLREINELTDLQVEYKTITKGRKVIALEFQIKEKSVIRKYVSGQRTYDILDKKATRKEITEADKKEYARLVKNASQIKIIDTDMHIENEN